MSMGERYKSSVRQRKVKSVAPIGEPEMMSTFPTGISLKVKDL